MKQNNNYEIRNFETGIKMAFFTLAIRPWSWYINRHNDKRKSQSTLAIPIFPSMIVDKKAAYSPNQLYIVASPDTWNWKTRYIGVLGLYKLEKECLRVRF